MESATTTVQYFKEGPFNEVANSDSTPKPTRCDISECIVFNFIDTENNQIFFLFSTLQTFTPHLQKKDFSVASSSNVC